LRKCWDGSPIGEVGRKDPNWRRAKRYRGSTISALMEEERTTSTRSGIASVSQTESVGCSADMLGYCIVLYKWHVGSVQMLCLGRTRTRNDRLGGKKHLSRLADIHTDGERASRLLYNKERAASLLDSILLFHLSQELLLLLLFLSKS
jgi:hypothetical protein